MCAYNVYVYYVYKQTIQTHACIYLRIICYVYMFNIFIYNIKLEYKYIHLNILKIFTVCVCIYIHNKCTHYTYIQYIM